MNDQEIFREHKERLLTIISECRDVHFDSAQDVRDEYQLDTLREEFMDMKTDSWDFVPSLETLEGLKDGQRYRGYLMRIDRHKI